MSRSNIHLKKPKLPWGFPIYRCTYNDDKAWNRMLELIQNSVQESVKLLLGDEETDLLQSHQLVIHDDEKKFNGATSHDMSSPVVKMK
ncbi:GDSL Lipase/Acylhydrolase family protein [Penicillium canescens]|nr:GDSL Lipase/Acylhydrolase family protein [Penicillium canescens]